MPSDRQDGTIRLIVPSDPYSVRDALTRLFAAPALTHLQPDHRGAAEIVLAEVLNNVVEHAYASACGEIEVMIRLVEGSLVCTILDDGAGMPEQRLPKGDHPDGTSEDPPEGGFGWYLIRALASDLDYRRIGGRNELSFCLKTG